MNQFILRNELETLIASGKPHTLIEALPRQHYEAGHLPGAINIPHLEIETATRLIPDKNEPIIVYCANTQCRNSHIAAEGLKKQGYTQVFEYAEGKKGWVEAGLQLRTEGSAK